MQILCLFFFLFLFKGSSKCGFFPPCCPVQVLSCALFAPCIFIWTNKDDDDDDDIAFIFVFLLCVFKKEKESTTTFRFTRKELKSLPADTFHWLKICVCDRSWISGEWKREKKRERAGQKEKETEWRGKRNRQTSSSLQNFLRSLRTDWSFHLFGVYKWEVGCN